MTVLHKQPSGGFALLLALLVVSVVVTVGLTVLEITIKQVRLSANAADSEISYAAANAGVECAQYWRRKEAVNTFEAGNTLSLAIRCFGVDPIEAGYPPVSITAASNLYRFQFTWGDPATGMRCSRITMMIIESGPTLSAVVSSALMKQHIPGYPGTADRTCSPGGVCTTLSVQGYNRACTVAPATFPQGTIERQILVEF